MNATRLLAALLALITRPVRDVGNPPSALAIQVQQPWCWAALRGVVSCVPVPGRRMPVLPPAVFLYAVPAETADAFDAAMRALVPAIRRAGGRAPYEADLPVHGLVGVATVRRVVADGHGGWMVELGEVKPLPFFLELEERPRGLSPFLAAPGDAADNLAWSEILEGGHRTVEDASEALVAMGFDHVWAEEFAESIVPALVRAEAGLVARHGLPAPPVSRVRRVSLIERAGDDELSRSVMSLTVGAA